VLELLRRLFKPKKASQHKEGIVKFYNHNKGFGFITLKDSKDEIFVHKTNLKTRIKQGNHVTFGIEQSKKGPVAVNVAKKVKA